MWYLNVQTKQLEDFIKEKKKREDSFLSLSQKYSACIKKIKINNYQNDEEL